MTQTTQTPHQQDHWAGRDRVWNKQDGTVKVGMFIFLSTLYAAVKSAPSRKHKLLLLAGIGLLYLCIRSCYSIEDHDANQLDILATVSRKLRLHKFAIRCGELGLRQADATFTCRMLLRAGLMRDHDAICASDKGGDGKDDFTYLCEHYEDEEYSPPAQKIRILRGMAWYANKYSGKNKSEAWGYADRAYQLAVRLGAFDQADAVDREFGHL
jgi:hypothetical protein